MSRGNVLPGHGLTFEGAPHDGNGNRIGYQGTGGAGRARCSCGTLSEILDSAAQRKRWHRDHKSQIRGDRVLEEIREAGGVEAWQKEQRP